MSDQRKTDETGRTSFTAPAADHPSRSRFCLWVAALAVVIAALLHQSLFEGRGLVPADGVFGTPPWANATNGPSNYVLYDQFVTFVPEHEFQHREFMHGRFPLWNPDLACGVPNVASMQNALLFPVNLLLLPLDPFYAGGIAAFLKLFLAGWFTMLYLRLLGASDAAAFLAGVIFSLGGFMVVWLGHPHVNSAMWLPLLLFLVEKSFRFNGPELFGRPARKWWAIFAVAVACLLLGGHGPTMAEVAAVVVVYFLFRLAGRDADGRWRRIIVISAAAGLGLCLAAPQVLPFLEYYRHSPLNDSAGLLHRSEFHLSLNCLTFYLLPHLSGSPVIGYEDTMLRLGIGDVLPNFNERMGYVGVVTLFLAIYALTRRCRWTLFYLVLAGVCLATIFGAPLTSRTMAAIPLIRDIAPPRLALLVDFALAVLAALGWDRFFSDASRRRRLAVMAGFWIAIAVALAALWHHGADGWVRLDPGSRAFVWLQLSLLGGSLLAGLALVVPGLRPTWRMAIVLGWITADLLIIEIGYNPAITRDRYYPTAPSIEWLQRQPGDFRIMGINMTLIPDTPEVFGLKDARGCDYVGMRRYEQLTTGTTGDFFFYEVASEPPPALPLLNTKYILTSGRQRLDPGRFELVFSNEVAIYRYRDWRGRVMAVTNREVRDPASILQAVRSMDFDPRQTLLLEQEPTAGRDSTNGAAFGNSDVRLTDETPDEVFLKASMSRPGFVLLLDSWFPGWQATVDGVATPVLRADYHFRAVAVPAGDSVVHFFYRPRSFWIGMICCFAALLVVIGLLFFPLRRVAHECGGLRNTTGRAS